MMSVEEIMDDFRRNGRECEFTPIPEPADRTLTYNPASPSCNSWPPDHISSYGKGSAFNVTNAHLNLARALSALSLNASSTLRDTTQSQQRSQFCQHTDRCGGVFGSSGDPVLSTEQANVLNFLQGNSLIHNELLKMIHEKAQELSQDEHCLKGYDMMWRKPCADPMLGVPMQAPRSVSSSRGRTRINNWDRCDSCSIFGRSSPLPRFENRPPQPSPRSSSRQAFNRVLNLKIQRDVEIDQVPKDVVSIPQYFPLTPPPSVSSSSPTTPETPVSPEETVKDLLKERPTKAYPIGLPVGIDSRSAPATPPPSDSTPPASPSGLPSPRDLNQLKEPGLRPKGNQNRRRYSSESQPLNGCAFCKKNGEAPSVYKNHVARDAEGQTMCEILQKYVCPLCGQTGKNAHTLKYCPKNLNPIPSPPERFRTSRGGNRRNKKSSNGAK